MKQNKKQNDDQIFQARLDERHDELRWLYMELYDNDSMFSELTAQMYEFYQKRNRKLKARDSQRCADPNWYRTNEITGMMLYIDNFAGNINGVREKLSYFKECRVNCVHLMPFLDTPAGRSDGGYAVSDFRKVRPDLGTMDDLASLAEACHKEGINLCMDFVMNHTSEEHEWAVRARQGDGEYMSRYFFFDNPQIPAQYESTVPQVFPTTAPGNFTWIPEVNHYVMTTFYPYQWDLNYRNPRVFNEMMYHFLYFANLGMDVIRIDAVPYIWKELGTQCRNLKQVHTIVRMMHIIGEIVCPAVLLLGEVVMEPDKVAPYFGTVEKPECHMLYNVTTMAAIWNSVATRDARLLKKQLEIVCGLPNAYTFLNYIRCHDDIGWGLDYSTLQNWGMQEVPHKRYLNDFFTGKTPGSVSRGELYNDDPVTKDARLCATTASLCGVEAAVFLKPDETIRRELGELADAPQESPDEQNPYGSDAIPLRQAIRLDLMLHAYVLMQSGIPMLYSGDEIGQLNDYSYKEDPAKQADSRYLHRGKLDWKKAERRKDLHTVEGRLFSSLCRMLDIRRQEHVFDADAQVSLLETYNDSTLAILREKDGEQLLGIFNFSEWEKTVPLADGESYRCLYCPDDEPLCTGERLTTDQKLPAFGFIWAKRIW